MTKYDLEARTTQFAKDIRMNLRQLVNSPIDGSDAIQLIRASGSIGANYIEANEAVSKKDFLHKVKIARKEAKECGYWLELLMDHNSGSKTELVGLLQESTELRNILSSIINKSA